LVTEASMACTYRRNVRAGLLSERWAADNPWPPRLLRVWQSQRLGLGVVPGEHGQGTPRRGERHIAVQAAAEQLQVVPASEDGPGDEHTEPGADTGNPDDAEGDSSRTAVTPPGRVIYRRLGPTRAARRRSPDAWRAAVRHPMAAIADDQSLRLRLLADDCSRRPPLNATDAPAVRVTRRRARRRCCRGRSPSRGARRRPCAARPDGLPRRVARRATSLPHVRHPSSSPVSYRHTKVRGPLRYRASGTNVWVAL
jgi:hypothetical protein